MLPAQILQESKHMILQEWQSRMQDRIQQVRNVPRVYLTDSMPEFLDELAGKLTDPAKASPQRDLAREHGRQRTRFEEYELQNLVTEYQILGEVLFENLEAQGALPQNIRKNINGSLYEAINLAIEEFSHLQLKDLNVMSNLFNALSKTVPEILWIANLEGKAEYFSSSWYEFTGLNEQDSLGDGWKVAIYADDREKWFKALQEGFALGNTITFEKRLIRKDKKSLWFLTRAAPLKDSGGKVIKWIGACTEIEEQKRKTEQLMEEKRLRTTFTNALTHDLRNPLQLARLNIEYIMKKTEGPETVREALGNTLNTIQRMNNMINDLLDAERIQAGHKLTIKKQPCNLTDIFKAPITDFGSMFGDRFIYHYEDPVVGNFYPEGMRRVLENLVSNAVKYGTPDTPIIIGLKNQHGLAILTVHNEGTFISDEDKELIFTMFGRGRRDVGSGKIGWGIGLSIVNAIVEAHQGRIQVESGPGKGTTFIIELPLRA